MMLTKTLSSSLVFEELKVISYLHDRTVCIGPADPSYHGFSSIYVKYDLGKSEDNHEILEKKIKKKNHTQ